MTDRNMPSTVESLVSATALDHARGLAQLTVVFAGLVLFVGTTVRVTLRDEATGAPINTASRAGYVVLEGERVNTTNNGTVSVSLDAPGAMVTARYEPGGWWHDTPGYQGDSQTITVGGPSLQLVATLFRFVVPVGLFLLAVYFVDRVTRWQIWPPWRGL